MTSKNNFNIYLDYKYPKHEIVWGNREQLGQMKPGSGASLEWSKGVTRSNTKLLVVDPRTVANRHYSVTEEDYSVCTGR